MLNKTTAFSHRITTLVLILASCAACSAHVPPKNTINENQLEKIDEIQISIELKQTELHVDYQPDELNLSIPVAAVTAAQAAALASNGSNDDAIAGGIVGAYIGIQIAQEAHKRNLQEQANKPVLQLKQLVDGMSLQNRVHQAIRDSLKEQLKNRFAVYQENPTERNDIPSLEILFNLTLNPDLTALHLHAEVQIESAPSSNNSSTRIYSREIDFHDNPLDDSIGNSVESRAEFWQSNNGENFWKKLDSAVPSLVSLIAADVEGMSVERTPGGNPIYFRNSRGVFYERGDVIKSENNRIVIRSLRGGIVSVPGKLVEAPGTVRN